MKYEQAYKEYLSKLSEAAAAPGYFKQLYGLGKNLFSKGIAGVGGKKGLVDFAKRYPMQLGLTGVGAFAGNRMAGNMMYGERTPGQSRGALGMGGVL